jgi:hypothetical protein
MNSGRQLLDELSKLTFMNAYWWVRAANVFLALQDWVIPSKES